MNQKTPYELIIAEKLQNIPIPDMADQIWSRVKLQLDVDMPADDGGDPPGGEQTPPGPGFYLGGFRLLILAAILVFLNTKPIPSTSDPAQPVVAPALAPKQESQPVTPVSRGPAGDNTQPNAVIQDREDIPLTTGNIDSAGLADRSTPNDEIQDSVVTDAVPGNNSVLQNEPPSRDVVPDSSLLPPKKKRGVPGITESDYRIVPKKNEQQP